MKRLSLSIILPLLIFLISCGPDKEKKNGNQKTSNQKESTKGDAPSPKQCEKVSLKGFDGDSSFIKYQNFLNELDCYSPKSIELASKELVSYISKCDTNKADSLFYIFNNYYDIVNGQLNEVLSYDTTNYLAFVSLEPQPKPSKKAQQYYNELRKNGFDFDYPEGMQEIVQDREFIKNKFYNYLSERMKSYLTQINHENKNTFEADAGILISEKDFFDRILWWERFESQNTKFLFSKKYEGYRTDYLYYALQGMDNTYPFMGNDDSLYTYFKNLYELAENAPVETDNIKIIKKNYEIIKANGMKNSEQRTEFIKELQKENKIMSY